MESSSTLTQYMAAIGLTLSKESRRNMSSVAFSSPVESRRKKPTSSAIMRREYAMFLEDMEIEAALSAGDGPFDLGDLADVGSNVSEPTNFDELLGEHLDPIAGREELSQSLAAFSVADLDWVMSELQRQTGSKLGADASETPIALDPSALDLPLAD